MREIQASDAKAHLPRRLDDVERGESLLITRHGRAIARIVPEAHRRQEEIDRAISNIKLRGKQRGKIALKDLLSARHAGHQYQCRLRSTHRSPQHRPLMTRIPRRRAWRLSVYAAMRRGCPA